MQYIVPAMSHGTKRKITRTAVAYRIRTDLRKLIADLSKRERISQTRFVEMCIERQAHSVADNPFPRMASKT